LNNIDIDIANDPLDLSEVITKQTIYSSIYYFINYLSKIMITHFSISEIASGPEIPLEQLV